MKSRPREGGGYTAHKYKTVARGGEPDTCRVPSHEGYHVPRPAGRVTWWAADVGCALRRSPPGSMTAPDVLAVRRKVLGM